MEKIMLEGGERDAWICLCGNEPHQDGFYPCDAAGEEVEEDRDWIGLYVCNRCSRIIDQDTLIVVGQGGPRGWQIEARNDPPSATP